MTASSSQVSSSATTAGNREKGSRRPVGPSNPDSPKKSPADCPRGFFWFLRSQLPVKGWSDHWGCRKPLFSMWLRKKAQPSPDAPYKISLRYKASASKKQKNRQQDFQGRRPGQQQGRNLTGQRRDPKARPGGGRKSKFWSDLRKKAQPSPDAPYKISPGHKASALKKSKKGDFTQNRSSIPVNSAE